MAKVTYRGISYDTERGLTKEHAYVKREFVYRGIKYTNTNKVEVTK